MSFAAPVRLRIDAVDAEEVRPPGRGGGWFARGLFTGEGSEKRSAGASMDILKL